MSANRTWEKGTGSEQLRARGHHERPGHRPAADSLWPGPVERPRVCPHDWFAGPSWSAEPCEMSGILIPVQPPPPRPKLLGGSSKLAKLAEERRRKAATGQQGSAQESTAEISALDRLCRSSGNDTPSRVEAKKYPIRKKREPAPPARDPTPPPEEPKEPLPDLRASPSDFGTTLAQARQASFGSRSLSIRDVLDAAVKDDAFNGLSPDDRVLQAQRSSKGLHK